MKLKYSIALILGMVPLAHGASTVTFSAVTGASNGVLTNLQSSSGNATSTKVWGILVDTSAGQDGFLATSTYLSGFSLAASVQSVLTTTTGGIPTNTNDVLLIASALMSNSNNATLDGGTLASGTLARPLSINFAYNNGIVAGQHFSLIWFDTIVNAAGTTSAQGAAYGLLSNAAFIIPSDGTVNLNLTSNFVGVDTVHLANQTLVSVPEPSAALLGALGALGLLRRRRI